MPKADTVLTTNPSLAASLLSTRPSLDLHPPVPIPYADVEPFDCKSGLDWRMLNILIPSLIADSRKLLPLFERCAVSASFRTKLRRVCSPPMVSA